ncbi:hypothetical protein Syun_002632 [Stephania yunnanensis]|uniref:FAS1 domain-containing protein n=1 Tax=Stephania yunnanensis TaxID=152371 RepID=A0AAP0LI27_9MAGN
MAPSFSRPHYAHAVVVLLVVLLLHHRLQGGAQSLNLTHILSAFPEFSDFNKLLSSTSLPSDLSGRSSLTLLAVPNHLLRRQPPPPPSPSPTPSASTSSSSSSPLRPPPLPPSGHLLTSLFQTTGRAPNDLGAVNISTTANATTLIRPLLPSSSPRHPPLPPHLPPLQPLHLLHLLPPPPPRPRPCPPHLLLLLLLLLLCLLLLHCSCSPLNITKPLLAARSFFVAASLLSASGVLPAFQSDEAGAGITLFVPTDDAFSVLPTSLRLQSLPADQKSTLLKFHVLHSYYPLGSLESIVNPVQPTLATEDRGAGTFTLNITRVNGSVAIDTGLVQASITQTVFDQNPLAIFAVSRVLLPREIFAGEGGVSTGRSSAGDDGGAGPPVGAPVGSPPGMESPAATHLSSSSSSSPTGLENTSSSTSIIVGSALFTLRFCWCIVGLLCLFV